MLNEKHCQPRIVQKNYPSDMKEEYRYYQTKSEGFHHHQTHNAEMLKGKDVSDMKTYKTI